jgi:predicted GIY-YIG superfamily endonuclease
MKSRELPDNYIFSDLTVYLLCGHKWFRPYYQAPECHLCHTQCVLACVEGVEVWECPKPSKHEDGQTFRTPRAPKSMKSRHYLGCTENLKCRIFLHRKGQGARLTRAMRRAGISLRLVRTWSFEVAGDAWEFEKWAKDRHNLAQFCPHCAPRQAQEKREAARRRRITRAAARLAQIEKRQRKLFAAGDLTTKPKKAKEKEVQRLCKPYTLGVIEWKKSQTKQQQPKPGQLFE